MHLAGALLVASMAMTTMRAMRMLALAAGLVALAWIMLRGNGADTGLAVAIWPALLVAVNAMQLAVMIQRSRTGDLREEERELLGHVFGIEEPTGQRRLRDLLRWIDIPVGKVLIREGQAEPPLVYIARGAGRVEHGGRPVGICGAGDFLGEMSLVSGQRASASVVVSEPMRVALFDRDALAHLSRSMPEVGNAIGKAINRALADKVMRMNRQAGGANGD
jgi:membrane protein implicated in regulation of membrane protease activity